MPLTGDLHVGIWLTRVAKMFV